MTKKPVLLCIMDGFGWTPDHKEGNAVIAANTPHLDKIFSTCPMTTIEASGLAVGLPNGQMGNSEVGHTNMGAGRIVYQQLTLITKSIEDGEMLKNPVLVKNMKAAIDAGKAIHLMGLVGTGGVHSHADHWFGVLDMAKHMGADKVYLHCIMDGRDTDPHSGKGFLADLQKKLDELGIGQIATVSGRYYAMDRDKNWDREEKAYAAFVYNEGRRAANAQEAIDASYAEGVTDEFVVPVITCEGGRVEAGDTVIFMNFRPDRARQMTRIFVDDAFDGFERRFGRFPVHYVCMAEYDATMPQLRSRLPAGRAQQRPGRVSVQERQDPAAHCRNREVRACDLLLQRRRRSPVRGRGPQGRAQPEGRYLRPQARDERARSRRRMRGPHRERQVRRHHPELCQLRHGPATPACLTPRSRPSRPWTKAWARWSTRCSRWAASSS